MTIEEDMGPRPQEAVPTEQAETGVVSGHTPGPWAVEDPMDHGLTIVANPDAPVYDWIWVADCSWPDEDDHLITSAQVKANARLIAAAPDLLGGSSALLDVVVAAIGAGDWKVDGACDPERAIAGIKAAIAKATAEASS